MTRGKSCYPDAVVYTVTHHIAVFEVQPAAFMSDHTIIEKYRSMERYCKEHGFMYMMVDPILEYMTFEEFQDIEIHQCVIDIFYELRAKRIAENTPIITNEDVKQWYCCA